MMLTLLVGFCLAPAREASSSFVSENFTATVLFGSVEFKSFVGASLSGTIEYDSDAAAIVGSTASTATYETGSIQFFVPSKGFSYNAMGGTISVVHMAGVKDSFTLEVPDGLGEETIFQLLDPTGTAFTSDALPTNLNLANFGTGESNDITYYSHHAFSQFDSTINSLVPSVPVPEPSSLVLSGFAAGTVSVRFAWRRSATRRGSSA